MPSGASPACDNTSVAFKPGPVPGFFFGPREGLTGQGGAPRRHGRAASRNPWLVSGVLAAS